MATPTAARSCACPAAYRCPKRTRRSEEFLTLGYRGRPFSSATATDPTLEDRCEDLAKNADETRTHRPSKLSEDSRPPEQLRRREVLHHPAASTFNRVASYGQCCADRTAR